MNEQYKTGDIVEVLDNGTAGRHMKGVTARVVEGNEDGVGFVFVEDPTGKGLFTQYGDTTSWIIDNENLRLVSEGLADWEKELLGIKTKQEEPEVKQELKVGDKVRVINGRRWHTQGESGKIAAVDHWGNLELNGWWLSPQSVELVTGKPKARSQEIELEDVQKNDLIVCFWSQGGVELRRKGVAHEKDDDGDWSAEGGDYLTFDVCLDAAEHIYLIERPEATGFDALDKAKKYLVKGRDGVTDFVLAFEEGNWTYGRVGHNTRVKAKQYEKGFTEGNGSWEKPVEYKEPELADGTYWIKAWGDIIRVEVKDAEATFYRPDGSATNDDYDYLLRIKRGESSLDLLTEDPTPPKTDLDKHTEAGVIGNRYRSGNVLYKVTKKGKVKGIIMDDAQDSWQTVSWDFETFQGYVDSGLIRKIS